MAIFDTHAHYDSGAFHADQDEVLASLPAAGVQLVVNPGCDVESSRKAVELAERYAHVYAAVGIHPGDCHYLPDFSLAMEELSELLGTPESRMEQKIVALGEIGLDYHFDHYGDIPMSRELQMQYFRAQMEIAQ